VRYTCLDCGKWVKDKFLFGTLHVCLTPEELEAKQRRRLTQAYQQDQMCHPTQAAMNERFEQDMRALGIQMHKKP